jgi:riboflavin kinase/FMN adenylyltransferase
MMSVVTIGAFDGIHMGHRRILNEVVMLARGLGVTSVVVTFDPHPMAVLQPVEAPFLLTSRQEKTDLLADSGVEHLVFLGFNSKLAGRSAEWFVKNVLLKKLNMRRLVIGYDFRFGRNREGDASYLESLGESAGFGVDIVPPVSYLRHPISSTRVRTALVRGDVKSAGQMLGRLYGFSGVVVRGEGRGVRLDYPTANLELEDKAKAIPANGVYAVRAGVSGREAAGVLYIGTKPTFGQAGRTIEAHIPGIEDSLYGKSMEILIVERLRGEKRFENEAQLRSAIGRDVAKAKRILSI